MSFYPTISASASYDSIHTYLTESERLLAGVPMLPDYEGKSVAMSVTDFCIREVERALADQHDDIDVNSIVEKLSAYGCTGSHLLAHLIAAKFHEKLRHNADILLDELRQSDGDLVFWINNFARRAYVRHTLCMTPLRFASLSDYLGLMRAYDYQPSQGQHFGL
jgi:hypothetical protein